MLDQIVRTIGSWGTGRLLISTLVSGPMAPFNNVQEAWLFDIQVMYCPRLGQIDTLCKLRDKRTALSAPGWYSKP